MLHFGKFLVVLLSFSLVVSGCGNKSTVDRASIDEVINKAFAGFQAKHGEILGSVMTSDVVLAENDGFDTYTTTGREDVVAAFLDLRSTIQTIHQITILDRSISVSGNHAVLTGNFFLDATFYTFSGGSRETTIEACRIELTRSSGQWLIRRIERML